MLITKLEEENAYLRQLLDAAVYGTIPDKADLTTMLYALRAKGYIKWLSTTMQEDDNVRSL